MNSPLLINEIFGPTRQGEGKSLNKQVIFIRTSVCNLACHFCLIGNTRIATPHGQKPIRDLKIGDSVYGFDFTLGNVITTKITNTFVRQTSPDELLELTVGNYQTFVTKNHEFYVKNKGFVAAENLNLGDIILELPENLFTSLRMQQRNPMKDPKIAQKAGATARARYKSGELTPYIRTEQWRKHFSAYRKIHNPMKDPEVVRRNAQSHFKKMSGLEEKYQRLFQALPIQYIGNNKLPVGSSTDGYRFPDFLVTTNKNKLIEIYDTTFRYGKGVRGVAWEEERRSFFNKFGYEVLFLTEKDIKIWKDKVIPFVFNGKIITSKALLNKKALARLDFPTRRKASDPISVYNIETGTHNYYANMALVHNCDTPYTWNWEGTKYTHSKKYDPKKEIRKLSVSEVVKRVIELDTRTRAVVISGGEPLIQQTQLIDLANTLKALGYWIEIETNGTINPHPFLLNVIDQINCSPKLANSGADNPEHRRIRPDVMKNLANLDKVYFKFVVKSEEDMPEIVDLVDRFSIRPDHVYLMPEGVTREVQISISSKVEGIAQAYGFEFTPRLHVLLYDTKRGV